jgi:hypothetical protein
MIRTTVQAWLITAVAAAGLTFWVLRSDRHRTPRFEVDCTAPPDAPDNVRASVGADGVTVRWQLARDTEVSTSYLVEARTVPDAPNPVTIPVPRGVDHLTQQFGPGALVIRVLAQNYCGTSLPSNEVAITVR